MQDWMRWEPTRGRRRLSSLVLTPARVTVGIGALLAVVAGLMPWAAGTAPGHTGVEPVFFSGFGGSGDGLILIVLAGAAGFLTLHRTPATSRVRLVHSLPVVLIVLAAMTWINGYRASIVEIAAWERRGGTGSIGLGLWLSGIGILVMAAGAVVLLPGIIRWRRGANDPADVMKVSARGVAEAVAGTIGIFVGGGVGIQFAVSLTSVPVIGLIALGAVFGGLLGAYAGAWIARTVVDEVGRRRTRTGGA